MGEKKNNGGGGEEKKDDTPVTVVLNIDMHCEGCATKIIKTVRGFEGVESVKAESNANKLTLIGKVDPSKVQQSLAQKTKKKVELVSPKKDNKDKKEKKNDGENNNGDEDGDKKKKASGNNSKDKSDEKKPNEKEKENQKSKEPPVSTAVLKLNLHCQGCLQKIQKTIRKSKGFIEMSIDTEKELVTVKGSMDMKALAENLKEKLRRPVDIVPPKKEKNGENGDEQKDGAKDNGGGGSGKKKKGGGNGGQEQRGDNGDGGKIERSKMEYLGPIGYGYGYGNPYQPGFSGYGNAYGYPYQYVAEPPMQVHPHPPQMFSDENPNACSVM